MAKWIESLPSFWKVMGSIPARDSMYLESESGRKEGGRAMGSAYKEVDVP